MSGNYGGKNTEGVTAEVHDTRRGGNKDVAGRVVKPVRYVEMWSSDGVVMTATELQENERHGRQHDAAGVSVSHSSSDTDGPRILSSLILCP